MAAVAPPPLAEVERAAAEFWDALAKRERAAWNEVADVFDRAVRHAERALLAAADAAAKHPTDPGYAFTARLVEMKVRDLEAAYHQAAAAARSEVAAAVDDATMLGLAAADAAGGVYAPAWVSANAGAVQAALAASAPGAPVGRVLAALGPDAAAAARAALAEGLALGWNPKRIARRMVADARGLATARARTIARTETMRAWRAAHHATYQQNADVVGGWVWHSARDRRTCALCWSMHGTVHPVDEPMAAHVNCRCRPIALPDLPPRALHDYVAYTTERLPKGMRGGGKAPRGAVPHDASPGERLFATLPDADRRVILGAARYRLYQAGQLRLADVVGYHDSPVWGRTVRLRALTAEQRKRLGLATRKRVAAGGR